MADSDDEYDRKRRDKFRGERSAGGDNYRSERRDDRSRGRDDWGDRGRGRPDYRDYRPVRDRYSPGREAPPVKRMRGDWDEGRLRYGAHEPYAPYGYPHEPYPMHGVHGFGGHPGGGIHAARNEPQINPDVQTQPQMMTLKQFLATQDDSISDSDAITKYSDYKLEFKRQQLNEFFVAHKDEEWFKIKYHPEESNRRREEQLGYLRKRVEVFTELLEKGLITSVNVDTTQTDQLLRLLDTVVIKLEGGTDEDLKVLDEKPPEIKLPEPKTEEKVNVTKDDADVNTVEPEVQEVTEIKDENDEAIPKEIEKEMETEQTEKVDEGEEIKETGEEEEAEDKDETKKIESDEIKETVIETKAARKRSRSGSSSSSSSSSDSEDEKNDEKEAEKESEGIKSDEGEEGEGEENDDSKSDIKSPTTSIVNDDENDEMDTEAENNTAKEEEEEEPPEPEPEPIELPGWEDSNDIETPVFQPKIHQTNTNSYKNNFQQKRFDNTDNRTNSFESRSNTFESRGNTFEKRTNTFENRINQFENNRPAMFEIPKKLPEITVNYDKLNKPEEEKTITIDLDKEKDVKEDESKALHKTSSIFLRNLAPTVTKAEVEVICKKYDGFLRVAIADPLGERRWFRRGWVTFRRNVNKNEICWHLNNTRLRDCELGAIVNRDLSRRVRPVNGITAHKTIVRSDIKLCVKIAHNLDEKSGLWREESLSAEILEKIQKMVTAHTESFGLNSKNPVLQNITSYLIEEASAEEDELLGISGNETKESPDGEIIERDPQLLSVLDKIILYLRIVHSVDFYNHCEYPYEDEMPNRCGIIHARGPQPQKVTNQEIQDYIRNFENKMASFLSKNAAIEEEELKKLGSKDCEAEVEKFVLANTQELSKDKWLCPLSGKKFKGPDFIRKHIFNKHDEKVDEVRKEVEYFNNYLKDSKRPQLPEHPGTNKKPNEIPSGGGGFRPGYPPGPGYGAPPYGGYAPPTIVAPPRARPGYGPRRGPGADYRPIIHYRDLDAPREPDDFI